MRFGTTQDGVPFAIIEDDKVILLDGTDGPAFDSLQDVISSSAAGSITLSDLKRQAGADRTKLDDVTLAAPIPRPQRNILCVGKNYVDHAKEFAGSGFDSSSQPDEDVPEHPIVFTKAPETVVGPGAAIEAPAHLTNQVDYEAEIGVVIGREGRFISEQDALAHVFGYTLINDVTARDLQKEHKQWFLGKSIDTFCPMGPFIVTADEVDLPSLDLTCRVNGVLRQRANARDMIFSIARIIASISRSMTLLPGDIIATGTPAGVGIGMSPPQFLQHGDSVTVASEQLGELTNPVMVSG